MPLTMDQQIAQALEILPVEGEVEFETYKAQLYAVNPDNGKAVFTAILKQRSANRRLDLSDKNAVKVYLSRKN